MGVFDLYEVFNINYGFQISIMNLSVLLWKVAVVRAISIRRDLSRADDAQCHMAC